MAAATREDSVYKRMRLVICSENRRLLLLSLNDGKKSLGNLREELHSDRATIIHALRELERSRLVQQDSQRDYSLTVVGRALIQKVIDCHGMAEVLTLHEAFWFDHDISGIPDDLLNHLGSLRDSTLITGTPEIFRASRTFAGLMEEGDALELITSVYSPEMITRLDDFISNKKAVSFVLTDDVLQRSIRDLGRDRVKQLLQEGVKIRVIRHDPKLAFVSTGKALGLCFAHTNGSFDYSQLLTSRSAQAIAWGRELFSFYVERSKSVSL